MISHLSSLGKETKAGRRKISMVYKVGKTVSYNAHHGRINIFRYDLETWEETLELTM